MTTPPADSTQVIYETILEIGIIEQLSRNAVEGVFPDGLRLSQFIALNHMVRLGDGWSPLRLARAFQVSKSAMTNTLQKLEAKKLVRVVADPDDGRAKRVLLTKAGGKAHAACIAALHPLFERAGRDLGTEDLAAALPALRRLRAYLDAARSA